MNERLRYLGHIASAVSAVLYIGTVVGDVTGRQVRRDVAEDPQLINRAVAALTLDNYGKKTGMIRVTDRINRMMGIDISGAEEIEKLLTRRDDAITVLRRLVKKPYLSSGFELMPAETFGLEGLGISVWEMLDVREKPQKRPPFEFTIGLIHDDKNRHLQTELYGNIDWLQVAEAAHLAYYHDPLDSITHSTRIPADSLTEALTVVFNLPPLSWTQVNDPLDIANDTFSFLAEGHSTTIYANTRGGFWISQRHSRSNYIDALSTL